MSGAVGSRSLMSQSMYSRASPPPKGNSSPSATWQPFFDTRNTTPLSDALYQANDTLPPKRRGVSDSMLGNMSLANSPSSVGGEGEGGEGWLIVPSTMVNLDELQLAMPERHASFLRQPAKSAPALPEVVQTLMNSTNAKLDQLHEELYTINVCFQENFLPPLYVYIYIYIHTCLCICMYIYI